MKPTQIIPLLALACVLNQASAQSKKNHDKETLAKQRAAISTAATAFCTELHREPISGLPSDAQMQRLSPFFTPEIVALIQRARVLQQEQIRRHPDEKPYWIEGDLFSSCFEGVTTWKLGDVFNAPTVDATVKVKRTCALPNEKPVTWTDTLVFKQRSQRWLLDDIRMGGEWDFKSGSSLRSILPGGGKDYQDHPSMDERWFVRFTRDGDDVTRVTIEPTDKSSGPMTLYGHETDETCPMPTWVVWGPNGDMIALRLGDGPRFTRTLIFRLVSKAWKPVLMPEFYPKEKKTMASNGFEERDRLIDAEHWQDASTLVVRYFGSFEKGDEGDGYHQFISVSIDTKGKTKVVGAVDVPGEE